jgi:hypothetical protein
MLKGRRRKSETDTGLLRSSSCGIPLGFEVTRLMSRGDGLLNIVRAFNKAIAGLSDRDTATYAQAFMGRSH